MTRLILTTLLLLAAPAWAQDAEVTFNDQTTGGLQVVVAEVTLPDDGYVAIHDSTLLGGNVKGSVVGVSRYLEAGTYSDLAVTLFETDEVPGLEDNADPAVLTRDTLLIAMPHMETSGNEQYDFLVSDTDGPFTSGGNAVTAAARVALNPATVTFNDQTTGGQQVVVDRVYLPDGGYVAVHDASLLDGNVKGSVVGVSEFLDAGAYDDVTVTLFRTDEVPGLADNADPAILTQDTTLIAMPHLETNGNTEYNFLVSDEDGPYLVASDGTGDSDNDAPGPIVDAASVEIERSTVTFTDQTSDGRSVTVERVELPDGGFVAIHDASLLDGVVLGSVVGVSRYFEAGTYSDVEVMLFMVPGMEGSQTRLAAGDTTLIAMPHLDTNGNDRYDFLLTDGAEDGAYLTDDGDDDGDDPDVVVDPATVTVQMGTPAEGGPAIPTALTLEPNAPNPFAGRTAVRFGVPSTTTVTVTVFDVAGRTVARVVERSVTAGWHEATVDGSRLAAGVYVYRVETGDDAATGRMVVVR